MSGAGQDERCNGVAAAARLNSSMPVHHQFLVVHALAASASGAGASPVAQATALLAACGGSDKSMLLSR